MSAGIEAEDARAISAYLLQRLHLRRTQCCKAAGKRSVGQPPTASLTTADFSGEDPFEDRKEEVTVIQVNPRVNARIPTAAGERKTIA